MHLFKLIESNEIKDLNITADLYQHPLGTKVIHLKNKDPENLFCISFPVYFEVLLGH